MEVQEGKFAGVCSCGWATGLTEQRSARLEANNHAYHNAPGHQGTLPLRNPKDKP